MIYVDRSRMPVPLQFGASGAAALERARAETFYRTQKDRQSRFEFNTFRAPDVRNALRELFHNKCAYCETLLSTTSGDVHLFRPKSPVADSATHPGYWWLATEWSNLLLSCPDCNRVRLHAHGDEKSMSSGKANRFPLVDESTRAFGPEDALWLEEPLLLDPCHDRPDEHLVFDWNGRVESDTVRGQMTIAVLGLNRPTLVHARALEARALRAILDGVSMASGHSSGAETSRLRRQVAQELIALTQPDVPYTAMKRQLLMSSSFDLESAGVRDEDLGWAQQEVAVSKARRARAKKSLHEFETQQSSFSLSDEEGRKRARSQQRTIERFSLYQFKGLHRLDVDLSNLGNRGEWLMLLGENGMGKSSILQAIALCLAGADYFATLVNEGRLNAGDLVNTRARQARVSIKLSGFVGEHQMTVTHDGVSFKRPSGETAQVVMSVDGRALVSGDREARQGQLVLLGYGATRLLPRKRAAQQDPQTLQGYGQQFARIDNLFDAFVPLFDANQWLGELDRQKFDDVALALKDLLALDDDAKLLRKQSAVHVRHHGASAPIQRLSDGFQSVVAMSVDILELAMRLWASPANAEGIVLLDEIGAHLHPTWKMRIVDSLRRAFPHMQFIATTHDPLCLRGLDKGEVAVMRRNEAGQIELEMDLPSPGDFRVDQLLTSEFFGLNSTVDPHTEELFDRYYALLALGEHSQEQREELERLEHELRGRRYVGDTLRDQIMFEVVDRVIARRRALGNVSIPEMSQAAVDELTQLWDQSVANLNTQQP